MNLNLNAKFNQENDKIKSEDKKKKTNPTFVYKLGGGKTRHRKPR